MINNNERGLNYYNVIRCAIDIHIKVINLIFIEIENIIKYTKSSFVCHKDFAIKSQNKYYITNGVCISRQKHEIKLKQQTNKPTVCTPKRTGSQSAV